MCPPGPPTGLHPGDSLTRLKPSSGNVMLQEPPLTTTPIAVLNDRIRTSMAVSSRQAWTEKIMAAGPSENATKFWSLLRSLSGKRTPNQPVSFRHITSLKPQSNSKRVLPLFHSLSTHTGHTRWGPAGLRPLPLPLQFLRGWSSYNRSRPHYLVRRRFHGLYLVTLRGWRCGPFGEARQQRRGLGPQQGSLNIPPQIPLHPFHVRYSPILPPPWRRTCWLQGPSVSPA